MNKTIEIKASHILMISDIHFGVHVNSEEWQDNIRSYFYDFFIPKIIEIKASLQCDEKVIVAILGDTFENRKSTDINVYNLAINVLEDISKEAEVYVLSGNHDLAKKTNEGNSSLRALDYIPAVSLIKEPTILNINYENNKHVKINAIPYLGDHQEEAKCLLENKTKYAFMHTEITKMKMDNGMLITDGVNIDTFSGIIFSGHIHKRQESKKCIYIGSPYHTSKSDMGNQKGLYLLNLKTDKWIFIENNYSPIYHTLLMDKYIEMSITEREAFLGNNYNYILIDEEKISEYRKKFDIYNLGIGTSAKSVKPVINKHKVNIVIDKNECYEEKTTSELINESILDLDYEQNVKDRLIKLSELYLKEAEAEISND